MGFYGNITNTSRTQFKFQRVYANRYLLDNSAATDGVYMGNYVLVDYDTELQADWCLTAYAYTKPAQYIQCSTGTIWDSEAKYYRLINNEYVLTEVNEATFNENKALYYYGIDSLIELFTGPKDNGGARITYSQCRIAKNVYATAAADPYYTKYILVPGNKTVNGQTVVYNHIGGQYTNPSADPGVIHDTVFRVIGWTGTSADRGYPLVEAITDDNSTYAKNFAIDKEYYNTPRGYDSTVWQKVYTGNPPTAHYVMLAELNTVVPTFLVSADAPTVSPMTPHFDTSSTNVLYNLHIQPSWGLRVKSAVDTFVAGEINSYTGQSQGGLVRLNFDDLPDNQALPSDESTSWSIPYYNDANNENQLYTYVWKDSALNGTRIQGQWSVGKSTGFTEEIPAAIYYNKAGFNSNISKHYDGAADSIQLTPTGLSGQKYHVHSSKYETIGTFTTQAQFTTYVNNLFEEVKAAFPNDRVYDTQNNDSNDMYHRDILYKRVNGVYVGANSFSASDKDSTIFYRKTTLPILGTTEAQVDTQELSIMLPSIGNSIASMWDLIYGDETINKSIYRNKKIDWLEGRIFHNDDGLRLVTIEESGYGYVPGAVETLAGTINTGHDLIGMMVKKRPENALLRAKTANDPAEYYVETEATIQSLSSSYIYYYPAEGRYYRRGIEYEWDNTNYTTYSATTMTTDPTTHETVEIPTRLTEEFLIPVTSGELLGWPNPNESLYYRELAHEAWTVDDNDNPVVDKRFYNFIIEQDYYHGRQYVTFNKRRVTAGDTYNEAYKYYTLDDLGNFYVYTYSASTWSTLISQQKLYVALYPTIDDLVEVDEDGFTKFEKYQYYNYETSKEITYTTTDNNGSEVIKTVTVPAICPSEDEEYDEHKKYFSINQANIVGDNYRFFEFDPDDITAQFYTVPEDGWEERNDVTADKYEEAPTRYYIKNGLAYERSAGYDSSATYYVPNTFERVETFDPEIDVYYTVEVTRTKANEVYVIQISYEPYTSAQISNATQFAKYICYIKSGDQYIISNVYDAGTTYYRRRERWVLTSVPEQITADNATQVKCIDPDASMYDEDLGINRPMYYYYNPVGSSGLNEFYGITAIHRNGKTVLSCKLNYDIVTLSWTNKIGFYAANTMYYRVENGPFKGSLMLDTNKTPTEGRTYYYPMQDNEYTALVDGNGNPIAFYEGMQYSDETGDLNSSKIYDPATQQYYISSPLYVYSIANDSPAKDKFQIGDRWNMDVDLTSDMKLTLRRLVEKPTMIPLNGYARAGQTMNGSILRVDEILSNNDTYTRSRRTIMGTINSMNDIIKSFKSIKANEVMMSDRYGHLYSRGIVLNNTGDTNVKTHSATDAADPWVHLTEERANDQNNWHIQVHHKLLNNANGTLQPITNTDLVINAAENAQAQTPNFGATFNILNRVKKDAAGHLHSITTDTVTIPLPSLTADNNLNTSNDYLVLTDVALAATTGAFTYRRHNVADLKLHDYSNTTAANYPTAGHIIANTQTINEAFAALETYIANSDLANSAGINSYITALTQTDGRISYSLTTLINTSSDVVLSTTDATKAQTAVSAQAVRECINDLDSDYSITINNGEYISGLEIRDGLIYTGTNTKTAVTTFKNTLTRDDTSLVAPQAQAVAALIDSMFDAMATNNTASTSVYITELSQDDNGQISYSTTSLLTTANDVYGANAGYAASGSAIRAAIDDLFTDYPINANSGTFMTGLTYSQPGVQTHYKLGMTTTAFITTFTGNTASPTAPSTAAVYTYLTEDYIGATSITTLGTIVQGEWHGTTLDVGYGGTGTATAPTAYGVIYAASASAYASTAAGTDGQYLKANTNSAPTWETFSNATVGLGNVTNDAQVTLDTFDGAYQLLYSTDASEVAVLSPNTTTTKMFLSMTGDGTDGAAPVWSALAAADIPNISATKVRGGVFELPMWAGAELDNIPYTVIVNEEETTSYPVEGIINGVLAQNDTTAITGTDTLITAMQKLRIRIDDLEDYIEEIFTANPTLVDPRAAVPEP